MPTFTGTSGADTLSGGGGNDAIDGLAGNDSLTGGDGSDTLNGGAGADTLNGGTFIDIFVIEPGSSPPVLGEMDVIVDFQAGGDKVAFANVPIVGVTLGLVSGPDFATALANANQRIATGQVDVVYAVVGSDWILFLDDRGDNGVADSAIILKGGVTTSALSPSNFTSQGLPQQPAPPIPPTPPGGRGFSGAVIGNMDTAHLSHLLGQEIISATGGRLEISGPAVSMIASGLNFTYDPNAQLTGGTFENIIFTELNPANGQFIFLANIGGPGVSAAPFAAWVSTDATAVAFATVLAGNDTLSGNGGAGLIRGYDGHDLIGGEGGSDTLYGGLGNDTITATTLFAPSGAPLLGQNYLRGDEGDDSISGAMGFDDANGNMGNDTVSGGAGDDYSVGGKDNDLLFGDAGADIAWGNLGNDTCDGGDGNDQVRGGQGDDSVAGGAGDDFVSGDRGSDTVSGGAGADLFHGSQDAGIDRVLDFHLSEGDRVQLDPGTTYTLAQLGADTVIDMGGGNQMILVGVQLSTLAPGWIFGNI